MKLQNRLYVVGYGKFMSYTLASCLNEAQLTLGNDCRVPDSDDIRNFWQMSGIARMTLKERLMKYGVSRQTLYYWRKKGGNDLLTTSQAMREDRVKRVLQAIKKMPGKTANEIAAAEKLSPPMVRRVAREHGITLRSNRRMPPDDKLIELATGRTWREFADKVGLKLSTLRNYIYRNKALTEAISKVRKPVPLGIGATRKLSMRKIKKMGQMGMSAYAIAEALKVEHMTIRAHLMRMGKESPDEFFAPYGKRLPPGSPVDGSHGGSEGQQ